MLLAGLAFLLVNPAAAADQSFTPEEIEFFERRVRPLLLEHCVTCHGAKKQESGLRLDSRAAILKGGDSGPAARSESPQTSLLIAAVRGSDDLTMPPDARLNPDEIDALVTWIKLGLPWPDEATSPAPSKPNADSHWAFQPVARPTVPTVKNSNWPRTDVDRFVLARLEQSHFQPAAEAPPHALIRRATLDLTGLPPTHEEVVNFEAHCKQDPNAAFTALVDRLLDSPHYGERWAR